MKTHPHHPNPPFLTRNSPLVFTLFAA